MVLELIIDQSNINDIMTKHQWFKTLDDFCDNFIPLNTHCISVDEICKHVKIGGIYGISNNCMLILYIDTSHDGYLNRFNPTLLPFVTECIRSINIETILE